MSEIPLSLDDQDDTEGHCLGVRLTNIEAAERELEARGRMPRPRETEMKRGEGKASDGRESGVTTHDEVEPQDVSGHVLPPCDLRR